MLFSWAKSVDHYDFVSHNIKIIMIIFVIYPSLSFEASVMIDHDDGDGYGGNNIDIYSDNL